jgi:SAM-dependent methyltransferase
VTHRADALNPARLPPEVFPAVTDDLNYSVRRHFVDEFYERHVGALTAGTRVIDIGGHRSRKRGRFDIRRHPVDVTYANIDPGWEPDIICDAASVPRESGSFDAVVLAEVVEHLPEPGAALREAARLLRRGGVLLATAPFLFRVHPDPIDVGRYAPDWWHATLGSAGFAEIEIERQGMMLSVLAEIGRGWASHLEQTGAYFPGARGPALELVAWARRTALEWESRPSFAANAYYGSFTTGYGVKAVRA